MINLSDDKLKELLELEAKATPGPWHFLTRFPPSHADHGYRVVAELASKKADLIYCEADHCWIGKKGFTFGTQRDSELISESRNHFRPLVEEVLRLREDLRIAEKENLGLRDELKDLGGF